MNTIQHPSVFENRKRSCTDWPCLLIFILLLILYLLFAIFVFHQGSLHRFIYPSDTQGRICGIDSEKDRKYLQFFDIIKCMKYVLVGARCPTLQICVERCPSIFYHYKLLYAQELRLAQGNKQKIEQIRAKLSCEKSAQSQVQNPKISIYSLVKERKVCAPYSFPSMPFYGRCIPSVIVHALNLTIKQADDIIKNRGGNTTDNDIIPTKDLMQDSLKYLKKALQIKRLISYMLEDLIQSRYVLVFSLLFAMIILVLYMFLLRYLARWMIWISLILCVVVFALAASFCFAARVRLNNSSYNSTYSSLDEMNITFNPNGTDTDHLDILTQTHLINKKPFISEKFDTAMVLLEDFAPMSIVWLVLGILCCVICGILMICICCFCERISLAAALIEEASKAICYALTTLLWPVVTFLFSLSIVIFAILVLAHYSTLGRPVYQISCSQDFGQSCEKQSTRSQLLSAEPTLMINVHSNPNSCFAYNEGDSCNREEFLQLNCPTDRIQCVYVAYDFLDETFENYFDTIWSHRFAQFLSKHTWFIHIFNLFIIYWLLAFIEALEEMVLACTFASYYWHIGESNPQCCGGYFHKYLCCEGIFITTRYHLGTIAVGSSIIAIIDTVRTVIDLVKDRLEGMNTSGYGKCCLTFIQGSLRCVRCCFQFFSRYTFIMTAISGKWFCSSAFTATRLLINNCLRVFVLDRVCAILLYIGRITITIGSCVFTAYILDRIDMDTTLHFSWFPVLIIGLTVYISSSIFLNVYSTAASTLFFCVLYDLEVHNDPQMESEIMSSSLKKILNKSNDFRTRKFQIIDDPARSEATQSRF